MTFSRYNFAICAIWALSVSVRAFITMHLPSKHNDGFLKRLRKLLIIGSCCFFIIVVVVVVVAVVIAVVVLFLFLSVLLLVYTTLILSMFLE